MSKRSQSKGKEKQVPAEEVKEKEKRARKAKMGAEARQTEPAIVACGSRAPSGMLSTASDKKKKLVLDMSSVHFINSTCMAVIHRYSLDARDKGGNLVLARAGESVKGILGLGGLDQLITMCDTVDQAADAAAEPAKKKDETDRLKTGGTQPKLTDTSMG